MKCACWWCYAKLLSALLYCASIFDLVIALKCFWSSPTHQMLTYASLMWFGVFDVELKDPGSAFCFVFGKEFDCWDIIIFLFTRKVVVRCKRLKDKIVKLYSTKKFSGFSPVLLNIVNFACSVKNPLKNLNILNLNIQSQLQFLNLKIQFQF